MLECLSLFCQVVSPEDDAVSALVAPDTSSASRGASVTILGPALLEVRPGASVSLECVVQHRYSAAPAYFSWFVRGRPLDLASHPGGLQITHETRDLASVSRLRLGAARPGDSGLYTCSPAPSQGNASVTLSVMSGSGSEQRTQSSATTSLVITFLAFVMSS